MIEKVFYFVNKFNNNVLLTRMFLRNQRHFFLISKSSVYGLSRKNLIECQITTAR